MEEKKSSRANLEKERGTFFLMGLVVVLAMIYVLLNWDFSVNNWDSDYFDAEISVESELDRSLLNIPIDIPEPIIENSNEHPVVYEDYNEVNEIEEKNAEEEPDLLELMIVDNKPLIVVKYDTEQPENELKDNTLETADVLPEFPGGKNALMRFIYTTVRYPEVARKQNIQGRVVCSFVIEKDGKVSEIKLEEGVYSFLDDEALRVLKTMPAWNPGLKDGTPVRVKHILPVYFIL